MSLACLLPSALALSTVLGRADSLGDTLSHCLEEGPGDPYAASRTTAPALYAATLARIVSTQTVSAENVGNFAGWRIEGGPSQTRPNALRPARHGQACLWASHCPPWEITE